MPRRRTFVILSLTLLSGPAYAQVVATKPLAVGVARSGVIQSIPVANGAHVSAGQILAALDCRPLEKEIAYRAASLAAEQAAFERVRNGPRPEEVAIGEAGLGVAKARAEEAKASLDRADALQLNVTITRAQLLEVQRDSRIADAQLLDAQKKLALLRAGSRAEDIAEAQARRDAAAALLEEGKAELDQCTVRAPAAGTVQIVATVGQFMSVYAPAPIAEITAEGETGGRAP
jgi:multidrug resistance efflux pump